jgi:hypothetical protein
VNLPPELLDVFPPSADSLFDWARRHSDDLILMEIANADYGHGANPERVAQRGAAITVVKPLHGLQYG